MIPLDITYLGWYHNKVIQGNIIKWLEHVLFTLSINLFLAAWTKCFLQYLSCNLIMWNSVTLEIFLCYGKKHFCDIWYFLENHVALQPVLSTKFPLSLRSVRPCRQQFSCGSPLADNGVDKPMKAPNTLCNPNLRPLTMSS